MSVVVILFSAFMVVVGVTGVAAPRRVAAFAGWFQTPGRLLATGDLNDQFKQQFMQAALQDLLQGPYKAQQGPAAAPTCCAGPWASCRCSTWPSTPRPASTFLR